MNFEAKPLKKERNAGKAEPYRTECGIAAALMLLNCFHDAQHVAAKNFIDVAF
jgi:hypothetical protein